MNLLFNLYFLYLLINVICKSIKINLENNLFDIINLISIMNNKNIFHFAYTQIK